MFKLKAVLFTCAVALCLIQGIFAADYTGNVLLQVLGAHKNAAQFKEFKETWQLDKKLENSSLGIKVYINEVTDRVESILIAGQGMEVNAIKFNTCTAKLPYGIVPQDDTATLTAKLGAGEKLIAKNVLRFYQHNIVTEVTYTALKDGKISTIRFYIGAKPEIKPQAQGEPAKNRIEETRKSERSKFLVQAGKNSGKTAYVAPSFKGAILDVFNAWKESGFWAIKADARTGSNFWNYKYAYNTKLKIPGEKYNMLYTFPFFNSNLDFVVVLKEADGYDASFDQVYHSFEKRLLHDFAMEEGWQSNCLPGGTKSRLANLELKNDQYGSVILEHSTNPRGRNVLLLRFLFYN